MKTYFKCKNCKKMVLKKGLIGTLNRNHCPYCLYSVHVDADSSGDRKAFCHDLMRPQGLTFKKAGLDKWGKPKQGELMLIHVCQGCNKISINRISSDDNPKEILEVFTKSLDLKDDVKESLEADEIMLLKKDDLPQIKTQLYGK